MLFHQSGVVFVLFLFRFVLFFLAKRCLSARFFWQRGSFLFFSSGFDCFARSFVLFCFVFFLFCFFSQKKFLFCFFASGFDFHLCVKFCFSFSQFFFAKSLVLFLLCFAVGFVLFSCFAFFFLQRLIFCFPSIFCLVLQCFCLSQSVVCFFLNSFRFRRQFFLGGKGLDIFATFCFAFFFCSEVLFCFLQGVFFF